MLHCCRRTFNMHRHVIVIGSGVSQTMVVPSVGAGSLRVAPITPDLEQGICFGIKQAVQCCTMLCLCETLIASSRFLAKKSRSTVSWPILAGNLRSSSPLLAFWGHDFTGKYTRDRILDLLAPSVNLRLVNAKFRTQLGGSFFTGKG